jgi:CBS domain-containing protein
MMSVAATERENVSGAVSEIMTREPLVADAEEPLFDAIGRMLEEDVRHLPVVESDGRVVGLLSDRDVRGSVGDPMSFLRGGGMDDIESVTVRSAMTPNPTVVGEETSIDEAIAWFASDRLGLLPVVDSDEHLVGVVSYLDALWYLRKQVKS